jgi:tetratricopeptide (TPR) repeat protein
VKRLLGLAVLFIPLFSFGQLSDKQGVVICVIHGRVNYANGSPVEGALVQLMPSAGGISQEAQTDKTGKFEFPGLSPSRYTVTVSMPGFMDSSNDFDMSITSSNYDMVTLRPKLGAAGAAPPSGVLAVLPADMPEAAKNEFNDGYNIVTSGKDLGKAIPHFKKVIETYPNYAPTYLLLGTAYVRTDKNDDAVGPLQKAIELDPKSADAYTVLGEVYNEQKKFPDAEKELVKAIELSPASFDAQYQLGRADFAEQKFPEAHDHLEAALKANPNSADAHIMMGNAMLRLRNAEGALQEYQQGVKLDPKGPMAGPANQMIARIQTALATQKK